MSTGMSNLTAENGCDLEDPSVFQDVGNLSLSNDGTDFAAIRERALSLFNDGPAVFIGGDHFITWPVLEGFLLATHIPPHLVQIDAHPDLYPDFDGNPTSHASVMARVMEQNLVQSLTQIGIRTLNRPQKSQVEKFNVRIYPASERLPSPSDLPSGPTYLSIDLDGLDPSCAPGVSHHEPAGLTTRQVITLLWSLPGPLVGADIVEYNPLTDINDMTAAVALKLLKEVVARLIYDHT